MLILKDPVPGPDYQRTRIQPCPASSAVNSKSPAALTETLTVSRGLKSPAKSR